MKNLVMMSLVVLALCVGGVCSAQDGERERAPTTSEEVGIWNQDPGGEEPDWKTSLKDLFHGHGCNGGLMDCAKALGLDLDSWPWMADRGQEGGR
jgi:hypothetical protein